MAFPSIAIAFCDSSMVSLGSATTLPTANIFVLSETSYTTMSQRLGSFKINELVSTSNVSPGAIVGTIALDGIVAVSEHPDSKRTVANATLTSFDRDLSMCFQE